MSETSHHFCNRSLPSNGLLQLQHAETELRSTAAAIQSLSPCSEARGDFALQTETDKHQLLLVTTRVSGLRCESPNRPSPPEHVK